MATQVIEPRMELEQNLHMYRQMAKIRAFEEQVNELYKGAKMPGLAHLYVGEEGVAVGVCEALRRDDFITSTHRGHGHCLAKGASVNRMFAELLGKEPGYCRGKGGSMHIADPETGNLGANAIVGGSAGIATGAALSAKMRGSGQVAVCFFGDGALGQGLLYESMNMAALWKLPVIYVCENNLYGEYTPVQRDGGRRDPGAGQGVRHPRRERGRSGRAGGQHDDAPARGARAPRRGPGLRRVQDVPLLRSPRGRREPGLPHPRGRAGVDDQARPAPDPVRSAHRPAAGRRGVFERIQSDVKTEIDNGVQYALAAPYPALSQVDEDVYA